MKATPLLLCLACSALAAPPAKKQPEPAEPLPALEKNTIAIDGHPESVAADAEQIALALSDKAAVNPKAIEVETIKTTGDFPAKVALHPEITASFFVKVVAE